MNDTPFDDDKGRRSLHAVAASLPPSIEMVAPLTNEAASESSQGSELRDLVGRAEPLQRQNLCDVLSVFRGRGAEAALG